MGTVLAIVTYSLVAAIAAVAALVGFTVGILFTMFAYAMSETRGNGEDRPV